ncbi:YncE family protein [Leucobacter sp. GX0328]
MLDRIVPLTRRRMLGAAALIGMISLLAGCAAEPASSPRAPAPATRAPAPTVASEPVDDAVAGPELLLASLMHGDAVAVIDPSRPDADAVTTIPVGAAPWGVGVSPDGRTGYAATAEGLAVVDLVAGERTALVPYLHPASRISSGEYRAGGLGLAVAPDGSRVYVAVMTEAGESLLEVFETANGGFTASVPVGARPFDVLVAPDGAWAATVDHDGFSVTVVDAATLAPTTHEIAPFGTIGGLASWEKPHYGAVDADGTILLPVQGLVVERLDPVTGTASTIPSAANSHSHGAALAPASAERGTNARLLTVGTGSFGNASGDSNLSILDLVSGEERLVPLRVPHETVAFWQNDDGAEFAVVAGGNTRELGWDGVTVVALDSLATRDLPVSGYPQAIIGFRQP